MKSKPLLFLLAHAGGSAAQYAWQFAALREQANLTPLDLPGHGERADEPLLTTVEAMAENVVARMRAALTPNTAYAVFGHSLGGLLAYLSAVALASEGRRAAHLFVSSTCIPGQHYVPEHFTGLSADEMWQASAGHFGGISREALSCEALRQYFAPLLQADLEAVIRYKPPRLPALDVPMTVFHGSEDVVAPEDMGKWRRFCTGDFQCHRLDGGHFYFMGASAPLLSLMEPALTGLTERG